LAAGLLDLETEKPAQAAALPDAPLPDPDLANCVPAPANRARPDLGSIEGGLHLGSFDANVQGIAAFMGGVFDLGLLQGPDTPAIYLYHRTDDLVVSCGTQPLFQLYPYCYNPINLCQPLLNRPYAIGSCGIADFTNVTGGPASPFFYDLLDFGPAGGDDCLDDPPGHSISNIPERCNKLSGFFSPLITATGNDPLFNCKTNATPSLSMENTLVFFPNPSTGTLYCRAKNWPGGQAHFTLLDPWGRVLGQAEGQADGFRWELGQLQLEGIYFIKISAGGESRMVKVAFH
jgi:hypothetical protein